MKIQIQETQKQDIQIRLKQYVDSFRTQQMAAASLDNCSEGTVIAILKGDWSKIADAMWLNVGKQVGAFKRETNLVETQDFSTLILYYSLAKEEGATFYMTGGAGFGKTRTAKFYQKANRAKNVYYLECAMYWNKKQFLGNLLQQLGKSPAGLNIGEMMDAIVRELSRQHQPLIILDEFDKLSDNVFTFFITLYNELNSLCGFVLQSTDQIQKRILRGLRSNRIGYQEFFSRIGGRFIELSGANQTEVREMCVANGITTEEEIRGIINEHKGDLRRLERHFLKASAKQMRNKLKATA
jgi:DNA transposition AAA+ family ATPase